MDSGTTVVDLYERCTSWWASSTALVQGSTQLTYERFAEDARRLARGLADLGIVHGDRVALLVPNRVEYVVVEYALAMLGAVRVPLAVALGDDDHRYMVGDAGAVALIYDQRFTTRAAGLFEHCPSLRFGIGIADDPAALRPGDARVAELIEANPPQPPAIAVDSSDLVGIYYTAGTTGRPKGVMLSHRAWVNAVMLEMLELDLGREERFAFLTPLTHAGGVLLLPVLLRRGTALIYDGFEPEAFCAAVEAERVTATMFVPTMLYALLDHPGCAERDLSSLRTVLYGAAPVAPERMLEAVQRFGPIFSQFYGQTEAPMILCSLPKSEHVADDPDAARRVYASCGRPTYTTEIRLVDDAGSDVATGEVGEIVARSAFTMDGYWNQPELSADTVRDGWLHTGDLAVRARDGLLFIVDRAKDMIVSGGFNVSPREVEDVLFEHPAVAGAAVIGVPDERWGEACKAVVVLHDGHDVDGHELIAWVKQRKGSTMAPKSVDLVDEIPLTNLGKVDKKRIREPYWEGRTRRV